MRMLTIKCGLILHACFTLTLWAGCSVSTNGHEKEESHSHQHGEEGGEIEISEKQMATVGIEIGHILKREMGSSLRANGILAVNPQDIAEISPLMSGIITGIKVTEGQRVRKGETVAQIENLDIINYQQDYIDALEEETLAINEKQRQEKLSEAGAGIRKNLEKAIAAYRSANTKVKAIERQLRQAGVDPTKVANGDISGIADIKSPIDGVVTKIYSTTGSFADMSTPVMSVTNTDKIFAQLRIYEKDLNNIEKGQHVDMSLVNGSGIIEGIVEQINNSIDPETKGINVRVKITMKDGQNLIPGMAVSGFIRSGNMLTDVMPEDAVIATGGKSYIYVVENMEEEDGLMMYHLEPVEVVTGSREQGYVEIKLLNDLEDNAKVVVSKAFYIASMASDHGEHNH